MGRIRRLLLIFVIIGVCFPRLYARKSSSFNRKVIKSGDRRSDSSNNDDFEVDDDAFQVEIQDDGSTAPRSRGRSKIIIPVRRESFATKLLKAASSLQSTLTESTASATHSISAITRNIKAYFASDFESLLLKLTIPDDVQPIEKDVSTFLETTKSFLYNKDYKASNNPYRITLRKLWAKITEKDIRTNLKAVYLLHFLLKFSEKEDAMIYQKLLTKMQREKHEKSHSTYYDPNYFIKKFKPSKPLKSISSAPISSSSSSVTSSSLTYQKFLIRYYQYIQKRSILFTSNFIQVKQINYQLSIEEICSTLCKGLYLLSAGMNCSLAASEENDLTILALELIAHDAYELYQDLKVKIQWVVKEDEVGDIFQNWNRKDIDGFLYYIKSSFNESALRLKDFIQTIVTVLEIYNVEFPFSIEKVDEFEISEEETKQQQSFDVKQFLKQFTTKEEFKALE